MTHLEAVELCRVVDEQCDAFEAARRRGERPAIEELLAAVPQQARHDLLGKLLAVELELIARSGEWPQINLYRERFPAHHRIVERAFDELAAWANSSQFADDSSQALVAPSVQDTERQVMETHRSTGSAATRSAQSATDDDLPTRVGRYEVIRELGRGGMGTVLLVHDPVLDRQVALKLPNLDLRDGLEVVERFYREARSMATVNHPNICPVYDAGEFEGRHFLTMAYVKGRTLAEVVRDGRLPVGETLRIVTTLAEALQVAHDAGVVHRDLKPSNVMITAGNEPIVMDFGLASRQHDSEAALTNSMTVIGSPAYMAPEQVEGRSDRIGASTDVYAVGVMLYELLSGRRPYEGTGLAIFGQITSGNPPRALSSVVEIDPRLEAICHKAMAHRIEDRYPTAIELAAAVGSLHCARGMIAPVQTQERTGYWGRLVGGSAAAMVVLAAIVMALLGGRDDPSEVAFDSMGAILDGSATGTSPRIDVASATAHLLPTPPAPTKRSTGRFVDSGQALGNSTSARAVSGDVDGDRDIDVVVVNAPSDQENQVWLNDGSGRFRPGQAFGDGTAGYGAALGDLDSDGDLDIVVACRNRNIPGSVWMNDGKGNFEDSGQSLGPLFARNVTLGDVDNDGDLDAFMTNQGPAWLFLNSGSGKFFDSGQRLGDGYIRDVELCDLDDDGDLDAVVGVFRGSTLILTNNGAGKFSESRWFGADDSRTNGIALADIDQDGQIDLFLACEEQPNQVWMNAGNGLLSGPVPLYEGPLRSYEVTTADLNGDGRADFFVANGVLNFRQPNQVLLATDAGFTSTLQGNHSTQSVAIADFDDDGDLDAFLANEDGPNRVWLNEDIDEPSPAADRPLFVDSGQGLGETDCRHVVLADLDEDGDLDAFVANYGNPDEVWLNDGHGSFADSGQRLGDSRSNRVALGDLDGDRDLDVFVPNSSGQPNRVYINEGGGSFRDSGQELGGSSSRAAELRDFDGDGDLDAAVANYKYGAANRLWLNDGHGQFSDSGQELGDAFSEEMIVADFDADGDDDLFFANYDEANCVWLNTGTGVFIDSGQRLGSAKSTGAAAADIDQDGDIDVFVANKLHNIVWLNDGNARFTESQQQLAGLMSEAVVLADADNDGDVDAFVANNGPNALWINDGTGLFSQVHWLPRADHTMSASLGDLNRNGRVDIFIANGDGSNRVLFRQQHDTSLSARSIDAVRTARLAIQVTGLPGWVKRLDFSTDGKRLLSSPGTGSTSISLWNLDAPLTSKLLTGHESPIGPARFSPDGTKIASCSSDGAMILWDAKSGQMLASTKLAAPVRSLAWSPHGEIIAVGSDDTFIRFFAIEPFSEFQTSLPHPSGLIHDLNYSPDGKSLAAAETRVLIFDAATGELKHKLETHRECVTAVAFSPDSKTIVSGGTDDERNRTGSNESCVLWNVVSGKQLATFQGHTGWISVVRFSPDGSAVASASEDGTVRVFDAASAECVRVFDDHQGPVRSLAFSLDGRYLASASSTIMIWDLRPDEGQAIEVTTIPYDLMLGN